MIVPSLRDSVTIYQLAQRLRAGLMNGAPSGLFTLKEKSQKLDEGVPRASD